MNDIKIYKGDKSYNINKRRIYICLKDKTDNYYPNNTLVYVLAHEIAHSLCHDEIGHTDKFNSIFDELLNELEDAKLYDPLVPIEDDYCMYSN